MNNSSENIIKHVLNSAEPNLLNNSLSFDQIRDRTKNNADTEHDDVKKTEKQLKKEDNLKTTETDQMYQYFANKEKMVPEENIQYFEKMRDGFNKTYNDTDRNSDRRNTENGSKYGGSRNNTERIDDLMSDKQNESRDTFYTAPKPSTSGPSYGDGPSVPQTGRTNEFATEEEEMLAKLNMLRQLGELTQYGVKLSQNYNMNSDYKAMKYEYELHRGIRDKHNGVKWMSNMMLNLCWGTELANNNFNPFDFKLKGWTEQMNEDIDDYYDVLGELYEKYFKSGKSIPPELKLFFMLSGSALKFHMSHSLMNAAPGLLDTIKNNPLLAKKLKDQAVADKVKEQYDKQKEAYATAETKQHDVARQKAEDINMLKEKQAEFMRMQNDQKTQFQMQQQQMQQQMQQQHIQEQLLQQEMVQQELLQQQLMQQQQLQQKQKQLDDLKKQLSMQKSDSHSMYTSNTQKSNKSTKNKATESKATESKMNDYNANYNNLYNTVYDNNNIGTSINNMKVVKNPNALPLQKQMHMPAIPNSLKGVYQPPINLQPTQMQEILRQQQMTEQKNQMNVANNHINDDDDDGNISFHPDIDNILDSKFNDVASRASTDNKSNASTGSKASSKRRKGTKNRIKIDTA